MRRIYKYKLDIITEIYLPEYYQILDVHMQGTSVCMWILVETDEFGHIENGIAHYFIIRPTGDEVDSDEHYIGTVYTEDAQLVFHVFETKDR